MTARAIAAALIGSQKLTSADPTLIGSFTRTAGVDAVVPTHATGDYLLAIACRQDGSGQPTLPAGWTDLPVSLGGNSPAIRTCYKIAASSSETATGFTSAQSVVIGVFRNVTSIEASAGSKTTATSTLTLDWAGFPSLTGSALIVGFTVVTSTDTTALRSDITSLGTFPVVGSNGQLNIGTSTAGVVTSWGATTSAKTGTAARAIVHEVALHKT